MFWNRSSGVIKFFPDLDLGEQSQGTIVWNQYRKFNNRIGGWCPSLQNVYGQQVR